MEKIKVYLEVLKLSQHPKEKSIQLSSIFPNTCFSVEYISSAGWHYTEDGKKIRTYMAVGTQIEPPYNLDLCFYIIT